MPDSRAPRSFFNWRVLAGAAALIALAAAFRFLPIREWALAFQSRLADLGAAGTLLFAAVYVVAALLLGPVWLLTIVAGLTYPLPAAIALVSVVSTLAAALAFLIARQFARRRVEALAAGNARFAAVDRAVASKGWRIVFLLRLSPLVPYALSNYFYGVTAIGFWPYLLASWIGMLPVTVLYVSLGAAGQAAVGAAAGTRVRSPWEWAALGMGLAVTALVTVWVTRLARRELAKSRVAACVFAGTVLLLAGATGCGGRGSGPVAVAANIDHTEWTRLLRAYVNPKGLVDYARWKSTPADMQALRGYLAQIARPPSPEAQGSDKEAALVNAYNALTISWILERYPTESIQALPKSFTARRHRVGGREVSLDDIEHGTLRPELGFLVHGALVCAARSCPPLAREAYRPDSLRSQLSFAMLRWLARPDLNSFEPAEHRARVSSIFRWNAADFESEKGGLRGVLSLYAPDPARAFVAEPTTKIEYLPYDWGLNDQGLHGWRYGGAKAWWNRLTSGLSF
ncbi:MAG TPA: VTT domain-containing protein [Thermoanaerobaculia bacterium]|nr:VTT domain-containing protein [Thermoanaerobaculia bacterium]